MATQSTHPNLVFVMLPVTAVECIQHAEVDLLLIGEGTLLNVHSLTHGHSLCRIDVLKHQAIHGIVNLGYQKKANPCQINFLVYGGRQIAWVVLSLNLECTDVPSARIELIHICSLQDWILCIKPCTSDSLSVLLLTSYNALCIVNANPVTQLLEHSVRCDSLSTFIYSADIMQVDGNSFIVASGTAFGELLIWLCRFNQHTGTWEACPWREYRGHSGSIFGVSISPMFSLGHNNYRIVATCSDDRTIHIWDVSGIENETVPSLTRHGEMVEDMKAVFPRCEDSSTMIWAHLSRIWSVDFILSSEASEGDSRVLLLSTGEDGQAESFSLEASQVFSSGRSKSNALTNRYIDRHHSGKNIWSRCHLRDERHIKLFTGGADGQVVQRSYGVDGHAKFGATRLAQSFKAIHPLSQDDVSAEIVRSQRTVVFKSYLIYDTNQIIATTDSGLLLRGDIHEMGSSWHVLAQSTDSQHFVLSSSLAHQHAYFVDRSKRMFCVLDLKTLKPRDVCQVRSTKVSTVQIAWSEVGRGQTTLSACVALSYFGKENLELIWVMTDTHRTEFSQTSITLPETFETTSACLDMAAEILLLGSRAGALAVFTDINDRIAFASPTICRRRVHGQDTVTSIAVLKEAPNSSNDELFFLTTGRDGTCCALQLDLGRFDKKNDKKTPAHIRIVHQATPPLGPNIEGAKVINRSGTVPKLLLYGFSSKQFVVWDEMNQTQVMAVACGGAHRSWHFRPDESTSDAGTFVWTQAGTFMSYQQTEADHKVIQPGGHGREIKALAVHYTGGSKWLVATGSEDTDIRLFEYMDDEGEPNLKSIAVIRKHTTGLQDLHFSPDGSTLISAAGMEEMFSWHLSPIPVLRQGVVFAGALPRTDEQSDARIMSFDVMPQEGGPGDNSLLIVAAFSNGKVKTIQYSPEAYTEAATFTVLHQLDLGTICLTQAHFLPTSTTDVSRALIGATNGFLTATPTSDQKSSPFVSSPTTTSHKVHQNSITAMAATNLTPNHTLITTGGDDNSLALTITHDPSNLPPTITTKPRFQTLTIPKAHAAALTALAVIEVAVPDSAIDSGSPFQNKHFLLITAGNDQIVASWHVKVDTAALRAVEAATADSAGLGTGTAGEAGQDLEHLHITLLEEKYTNVADISGIAILQKDPSGIVDHDIRSVQVMIVGVGMEVLEVEVPRLEGV